MYYVPYSTLSVALAESKGKSVSEVKRKLFKLSQTVEQRFRLLEVGGVKAFGKPMVNLR
jgi:hypothetical protein